MSASGVDKSNLEVIGRDILLVSDYDRDGNKIVLSVPPVIEPRRVSVDAIEHWMIYQQHPGVGAILHVHAWMQGIAATDVNYRAGRRSWPSASPTCSPRSRTRPRGHRPAQPRHHRHRREPGRDPRPHRAQGPPPDPNDLTGGNRVSPGSPPPRADARPAVWLRRDKPGCADSSIGAGETLLCCQGLECAQSSVKRRASARLTQRRASRAVLPLVRRRW